MTDEPSDGPTPERAGVPRTPEQRDALLTTRPAGWELLLFAALLLQGKQDLELRWRDHQLQLPTGEYHRVDEEEVADYLSAAFGRLGWTIGPIGRVFDAQED